MMLAQVIAVQNSVPWGEQLEKRGLRHRIAELLTRHVTLCFDDALCGSPHCVLVCRVRVAVPEGLPLPGEDEAGIEPWIVRRRGWRAAEPRAAAAAPAVLADARRYQARDLPRGARRVAVEAEDEDARLERGRVHEHVRDALRDARDLARPRGQRLFLLVARAALLRAGAAVGDGAQPPRAAARDVLGRRAPHGEIELDVREPGRGGGGDCSAGPRRPFFPAVSDGEVRRGGIERVGERGAEGGDWVRLAEH